MYTKISILRNFKVPIYSLFLFLSIQVGLSEANLYAQNRVPSTGSRANANSFVKGFDLLTSGDCVLQRGQITLSPDGSGQWEAWIHTNHTTNRDIWHMNFVALDSSGNQLFWINIGDSPDMYGSPSPTIPWATDFQFPSRMFPRIATIRIARNSC
jgi:Family of unknown function (DUF6294)